MMLGRRNKESEIRNWELGIVVKHRLLPGNDALNFRPYLLINNYFNASFSARDDARRSKG